MLQGTRTHLGLGLLLVGAAEHRLMLVHLRHLWRWSLLGVGYCAALAGHAATRRFELRARFGGCHL